MLVNDSRMSTNTEDKVFHTYKEHTVDVVHISVLPSPSMNVVPWHTYFRAVKNGRFVHVIPDEKRIGRVLLQDSATIPLVTIRRRQEHTFQTLKSNILVHQSQLLGLKKSTHALLPVQHHPSKLLPSDFLTSMSRSLESE